MFVRLLRILFTFYQKKHLEDGKKKKRQRRASDNGNGNTSLLSLLIDVSAAIIEKGFTANPQANPEKHSRRGKIIVRVSVNLFTFFDIIYV